MRKVKVMLFLCVMLSFFSFAACGANNDGDVIALDKTEIVIGLGKTDVITATLKEDSLNISWNSSDDSVVSVYKGNIKAEGVGKAKITAKVNYNNKDYFAETNVKVIDYYKASFEVETVFVNDEINIVPDDNGIANFIYKVSAEKDEEKADVIENGIFKAKESGEYVLTYNITGEDILDTVIKRTIIVKNPVKYGELFDFSSLSGVNVWSSNNTDYRIVTDDIPSGVPESSSALKIDSDMNVRVTMKSVNVSSYIKDAKEGDYFEISYYIKSSAASGYFEGSLIDAYMDLMSDENDGFNSAIVKRYATSKFTVNKWAVMRVFVREIENYVKDNENLYIRPHFGLISREKADMVDSIYINDFRFVAGDIVSDTDTEINVALPVLGFTKFDYTAEIRKNGEAIKVVSNAEPVISDLSVGEYDVVYHIDSNQMTESTITRKLTVKNENEYVLSGTNVFAYHMNNAVVGGVEMTDELLPEGAPAGSKALKISSADSGFTTANSSSMRLKFKNINLVDIANNEEYADGYLSFIVYFRHITGVGYENDWDDFYMMDSNDSITWYNVGKPTQLFASKTVNKSTGLLKGMIKPGAWSEIKIPVSYIKEILGLNTLTGYNVAPVINPVLGVNNHCASGGAAFSQPYEFFVYSVCVKAADEYTEKDFASEKLLKMQERDITYSPSAFESYSYTVKADKNGEDVTESVIKFADNKYTFKASEDGTYVITYTVKATFFKEFTFTRTFTVAGDSV